jgi:hypothetical protein
MLFGIIGDLVAHAAGQIEPAPIFERGRQIARQAQQDMTIRTRIWFDSGPKGRVRQIASPTSPACRSGSTLAQSVVPNGMASSRMR